jgi:hypothetical protein
VRLVTDAEVALMDLKDVREGVECLEADAEPAELVRIIELEAQPGDCQRPHVVKGEA